MVVIDISTGKYKVQHHSFVEHYMQFKAKEITHGWFSKASNPVKDFMWDKFFLHPLSGVDSMKEIPVDPIHPGFMNIGSGRFASAISSTNRLWKPYWEKGGTYVPLYFQNKIFYIWW